MKVTRKFTKSGQDVYSTVSYEKRTSRISNPDGSVVFEMTDAEIPAQWSQLATDIMVSKYFRKAGVPAVDAAGKPVLNDDGSPKKGPEKSARQVIHRLAGCWRHWGETHGYFDSPADAQAFYDELAYMLLHQMCAPNSPQWFNTGLNFAYGISGPAQGHYYCDPKSGELKQSADAYTHPQPHACFIQGVSDDLVNNGGIMDLWVREARLFKYGSGTGSNFSKLRGEAEPLSGGGKSSGLMSFLKIGDRAAGAIKSGGTTRRAAKMVCLDLDHPDIESFVNWKVREELKVAALAEGIKHIPKDQQDLAKKLGLKLDYDFNGEAYYTVSGQNSNNSVRIPNSFFEALENDADWHLTFRTNAKKGTTIKARDLWEQIAYAAWRCADPGVQYDTTINEWHTCPASGRINASNPCVTGDTRVLTPGGVWRRIDQMIYLPSRLVTNVAGMAIGTTEGAFPTGTKEVFELTTEAGYTLKLTGDHKVWTLNRGWVEARELTTSDDLCLPGADAAVGKAIGEPQDAEFFHLVGIAMSQEGDLADGIELGLLSDGATAERLSAYANAFGADESGSTMTLTAHQPRLLARVKSYVRGSGSARSVSDEAFTSGLAAQKHVLRGLFAAVGERVGGTVVLRANARQLLADVQLLLTGFGVLSRRTHNTLTIDASCLAAFQQHIGFAGLTAIETTDTGAPRSDRMASLISQGSQPVFDLTEPATHSFIANGLSVHNCSEYMFLDDTACNLASLNVLQFFDSTTGTFDMDAYRHGIRLWTIVLEISVLMASFPSEEIAKLSYKFRTLGLGYANLGAMLMQAGIPYDSDAGRAVCAALSSVMTGESYATSAEMAGELGAFPGYAENKDHMLRVIRNHRRAAYGAATSGAYESLTIKPVEIDAKEFSPSQRLVNNDLLAAARDCWDRALALGQRNGYRNAQTTVIAPTGTIGLLMDCDTTGVEPDFALVKFKKLAGGGYFKIANQSLEPALANLGYNSQEIKDILDFVLGTMSLATSPHINRASLKLAGLTDAELDKVEKSLPGMFELSFAFSPWTLGAECMKRLEIPESEYSGPTFSLLKRLGFSKRQIEAAGTIICGTGTVESAPHLKVTHYPVFDCANKCGKSGKRFIAAEGHIRMMAAAQPFISGAISKTINLPNEATVDEVKQSYLLSWELGLKANALYRDGSKLSQPLNVKSDTDLEDKSDAEDEANVAAALEDLAVDAAKAADALGTLAASRKVMSDNLSNPTPEHTRVVERIVERVVERPLRRRLPDTRRAVTHKFDVQNHEGYITVGLYEDGSPGEVFITMAKEGSTIGGLMDTIATLVSVSLQYGVPVESLVRKFEHVRFEPSGMTRNPEIPMAKSLVDYIFRFLAMEFVPGYRLDNAPRRSREESAAEVTDDPAAADSLSAGERAALMNLGTNFVESPSAGSGGTPTSSASPEAQPRTPITAVGTATNGNGNHHGQAPKPVMQTSLGKKQLAKAANPLNQQGSDMQSDAPACDVCGSITVRSGTCYKCLNCGNSMGCS